MLADLITEGVNIDIDLEDPDPDSIFTIWYTSGTTGNPKGVVLSHQNIIAELANLQRSSFMLKPTDIHISYLPLAHIMERVLIHAMILNGWRAGFYQGDVLKLKEDLAELKPTIFVSVPRLYWRFYDLMQSKLSELKGMKMSLANRAIKSKLANLAKTGKCTHCFYDRLVFKKFKAVLGGRVRLCATASAPISKDILDFMKIAFCWPVIEAYGQTELAGASNATDHRDVTIGHVGGVLPSFYMKLQDVPEMDYFSTDIVDGFECPRGEVCFKGSPCFVGYFKEPEKKTAETIDSEGWLHTGDIGVILPNGALKVIDRKKNIFKLSQGEYIAAEKLEILFSKSPLIKQIFVYGDSLQAYLVTIVIPEKDEVLKEFPDQSSNYEEFINSKDFHSKLSEWFNLVRKTEKLNGLEVPKNIFCTSKEFSIEDGTLTPTFKLVRGEAKKLYIDQIRRMYDGAKLQGE